MAETLAAPLSLFAFECSVKDCDGTTIVNAPSAGKARYHYWLRVSDPWPDVKLVDIRVRKVGAPRTSERLRLVGEMRGWPLKAGDRVTARTGETGTVCDGGGGGAYFEVWFDSGHSGFVHPGDLLAAPSEVARG